MRRTVRTLSATIEEEHELTPAAISHLLELQERVLRRLKAASASDAEAEFDTEELS